MGRVVGTAPCPKCREEGRDNTGDNLRLYDDGSGYCFACKYNTQKVEATVLPKSGATSRLTVEECNSYPQGHDPNRLIDDTIIKEYDIRVSYDEELGKVNRIFYPYYDDDGRIIGYKIKTLPKKFMVSNPPPRGMFGKQTVGKHKGKKYLIVTEGEEDCLAAKHMMTCSGPPVRVDVVSMPNGASLDSATQDELDFFMQFERVYLAFDADKPGQKAQLDVADWLCKVTEVRLVKQELPYKDASGYRMAGQEALWRGLFKDAEVYEPEGIVNGMDIELDDLLVPLPEGYKTGFAGIDDKLHGVRKAEIVTVCAGSGIGKSTLVREMCKSLIEQGCSVANIALEDQMNVAAQALIALDMNIPLARFRTHPPDKSEIQPHFDKMVANGSTYFYKHFAGINSESLITKLYYYARSKSVDFIILDHLSMVISSSRSRDERKDIDHLMTELAKLVVETGVGLIQIVHLKRTSDGKSFAHGGEVELTDLRGSAALEQLSWAVIGLERDQQGDDSDFSRIRILKNRTWGFTGLAGNVKYDTGTGRLKDVVQPEFDPAELESLIGEYHEPVVS